MPGVGDTYEPTLALLEGIAIPKSKSDLNSSTLAALSMTNDGNGVSDSGNMEKVFWKYFPCKALPTQTKKRFDALFAEQTRWKFNDLKPYFVEFGPVSSLEKMFLKFTRMLPDENESSLVWYVTKSTNRKK
jgi:hypothetical protein